MPRGLNARAHAEESGLTAMKQCLLEKNYVTPEVLGYKRLLQRCRIALYRKSY